MAARARESVAMPSRSLKKTKDARKAKKMQLKQQEYRYEQEAVAATTIHRGVVDQPQQSPQSQVETRAASTKTRSPTSMAATQQQQGKATILTTASGKKVRVSGKSLAAQAPPTIQQQQQQPVPQKEKQQPQPALSTKQPTTKVTTTKSGKKVRVSGGTTQPKRVEEPKARSGQQPTQTSVRKSDQLLQQQEQNADEYRASKVATLAGSGVKPKSSKKQNGSSTAAARSSTKAPATEETFDSDHVLGGWEDYKPPQKPKKKSKKRYSDIDPVMEGERETSSRSFRENQEAAVKLTSTGLVASVAAVEQPTTGKNGAKGKSSSTKTSPRAAVTTAGTGSRSSPAQTNTSPSSVRPSPSDGKAAAQQPIAPVASSTPATAVAAAAPSSKQKSKKKALPKEDSSSVLMLAVQKSKKKKAAAAPVPSAKASEKRRSASISRKASSRSRSKSISRRVSFEAGSQRGDLGASSKKRASLTSKGKKPKVTRTHQSQPGAEEQKTNNPYDEIIMFFAVASENIKKYFNDITEAAASSDNTNTNKYNESEEEKEEIGAIEPENNAITTRSFGRDIPIFNTIAQSTRQFWDEATVKGRQLLSETTVKGGQLLSEIPLFKKIAESPAWNKITQSPIWDKIAQSTHQISQSSRQIWDVTTVKGKELVLLTREGQLVPIMQHNFHKLMKEIKTEYLKDPTPTDIAIQEQVLTNGDNIWTYEAFAIAHQKRRMCYSPTAHSACGYHI